MLHRDMGTLVSNSPWTQAGFEWTISIISAAPSLMHPTASIQPIYPVCLTFAPQPWWWRDDHAHLSHCGGTKNPDSFSQKQDSSPPADKQLVSCFIFLQAEAKMKWFHFQRVAGIYRGGCERKTSWNWRQMLPSTKICPCKSPSHQMWLEALKRLQFSSIDLTLASTSPIYKLLTHPNDWQRMQSWIRHQGRKHVNNTPRILLNNSMNKMLPVLPICQTCSLAPKTSSASVFWRQQRPSGWFCTLLPLDASQKKQREITALTFAWPNSGLLQPEKMTLAGLPSLYSCNKTLQALSSFTPFTSRNTTSPHLRRERDGAILNCFLFPGWEEAVLPQYTHNKQWTPTPIVTTDGLWDLQQAISPTCVI